MNLQALTLPRSLLSALAPVAALGAFLVAGSAAASPAAAGQLQAPAPGPSTIVGGDVNSGDPSVPLLVVYGAGGEQSICSGSLVGPQWILTAAHCVDTASLGFEPAQIEVYFGTQYSEQDPGYIGSTYADSYTYHERWDTNNLEAGHDIAVIHLQQTVDLPLMPLMARPLAFEDMGSPVRLIGWGLTFGDRQDSGVKRHVMSSMFDFTDLLVQIGDANTNVCSGDSGGPAVMSVDGQEVQIGVTSFGDTQCAQFGIDTRVDAFADWIADATGGEVVAGAGGATPPGGGGEPAPGEPQQPPAGGSCETHDDCGGGLCVSDGTQSLCTTQCTSSEQCGAGMDCFETDDPSVGVCWPSDEPGSVDPDDDGVDGDDGDKGIGGGGGRRDDDMDDVSLGCSVNPQREAPAGLLALAGLALFGFRRRRS